MDANDEKKKYLATQYRVASISYGLFFCLIGCVLNTIEPFKACTYLFSLRQFNNFVDENLLKLYLFDKTIDFLIKQLHLERRGGVDTFQM